MPQVAVNGIKVYYEIHGKGDPLVLIMGLRRNAEWWYCQIPALSEHFKVIAFDNRGAGRSEKPRIAYSIRLFADDTAALLEALKIKSAHVLGISMGGYIAQELAINYPDNVRRLILGCTSCGGERAVLMSQERMKEFEAVEGLTPEEILRKNMDIYFSDAFIQEHPEKIEEFMEISFRYPQPPEFFERQFAACLKHDTVDRLEHISAPTLIMAGVDDPLVPSENSRILKHLMPGAELFLFPDCRHCFFIEASEEFNQRAVDFFSR